LKRKETGILAVMGILSIIAGVIVLIITGIEFISHSVSFGSTGIGIALGVILIVMGFISRTE
jgi:uncharacterized membrane protein (DUF485 family)